MKTGAWLHINAQLIDTHTDTHVWAKQYDGDFKKLFAIQSEIAQTVAGQLHAKISAAEKLAIERPPTADLTAFYLYSRAKNLVLQTNFTVSAQPNFLTAIDLLNQARRSAIVAKEIKPLMRIGELAISLEKCRIMRDSLVQKIDRSRQLRFRASGIAAAKEGSSRGCTGRKR